MPDTPLNPDALEAAARALLAVQQPEVSADYAWNVQFDDGREELRKETAAAVSAYLAAAQPELAASLEQAEQAMARVREVLGGYPNEAHGETCEGTYCSNCLLGDLHRALDGDPRAGV